MAGCGNGNGFVQQIKRLSANSFLIPFDNNLITCTNTNPTPDPANELAATVSAGGVALTWLAPSGGLVAPTNYKILKKTNGVYVEVGTSTTLTYTDASGLAGDIYRVVASHTNGDSIASSAAKAE